MVKLTREQISATAHLTSREAARILMCGKTSVNKYRKIYGTEGEVVADDLYLPNAKILTIDIESKPMQAYVWSKKADWIPDGQLIDPGGMICFAAKWLGKDEVVFYSDYSHGHEETVRAAHKLLSEADIVVTYNGDRYDIKRLNNEFLQLGMAPPKPFRSIDLFKTNRSQFDLPSRKLDYIAQATGVGSKVSHTGFQLWIDCMEGDPEAWTLMQEYNEEDVRLTERLYIKLLPWLANVPHMAMFNTDGGLCPYCGFGILSEQGTTHTQVQEYTLYHCGNCEGWSRSNKPLQSPLTTRKVAR